MDFYVVLGVAHEASPDDIRRAYKRLARRYHPDINPGDRVAAARFEEILHAYETLIDPARRSHYDDGGSDVPPSAGRGSGFEGFDFSGPESDQATTFGDLFADVIARRAAGPAERGADLHSEVPVSFDESLTGTRRAVTVTRQVHCGACEGRGAVPTRGAAPCLMCQGQGTVRSTRRHMVFSRACPSCGGTGARRPGRCEPCAGTGRLTRSERVLVDLPAGVGDGEQVRVPDAGHVGADGAPPGDLYLTVRVTAHPEFRRDGDDLHVVLPVAVHEAGLGARVPVPTPEGPVMLRVPPGTQTGQRFRLRDRGAASRRAAGQRGDLIVEIRITLPEVLDERSKELLRDFGRINGRRPAVEGR
jgi:molecular chaperone DnaJ